MRLSGWEIGLSFAINNSHWSQKKRCVMKIAVFSDVHGNLKALKAVLEQIKEKKES